MNSLYINYYFKQLLSFKHTKIFSWYLGGSSEPDEPKAFYALGVNIALQVAGEIKGLLSKEEIAQVIRI